MVKQSDAPAAQCIKRHDDDDGCKIGLLTSGSNRVLRRYPTEPSGQTQTPPNTRCSLGPHRRVHSDKAFTSMWGLSLPRRASSGPPSEGLGIQV